MQCPSCQAPVADGAEFCPQCLGAVSAPKVTAAAPVAEPEVPPAPVRDEFAVDPNAPRCPDHPDKPIVGTCTRCGRFYCIDCVPTAAQHPKALCPVCERTRPAREAPAELKKLIREFWISLLVLGFLVLALTQMMQVLIADDVIQSTHASASAVHGGIVVIGFLLALPFVVIALLLAVTGKPILAWLAFGLEALVFTGLLLISFGPNLMTAVSIGVPLYSLIRLLKMGELRRLVAESGAAPPG